MKMLRGLVISSAVVFFGLTLVWTPAALSGEGKKKERGEKTVEWKSLPQAVQAALTRELHGAKPEKIEMERDHGFVEYEAKAEIGGVTKEFKVTADGQLIEVEQKLDAGKLPRALSDAIHKRLPGAKLQKAELVNLTYYEVRVLKDGRKQTIKLLANGRGIKIGE